LIIRTINTHNPANGPKSGGGFNRRALGPPLQSKNLSGFENLTGFSLLSFEAKNPQYKTAGRRGSPGLYYISCRLDF
jgi:hypothetical protein